MIHRVKTLGAEDLKRDGSRSSSKLVGVIGSLRELLPIAGGHYASKDPVEHDLSS